MKRKGKRFTIAQRDAMLRNRLKGSTAMIKGLIFWMLRGRQRMRLTQRERNLLGDCLFNIEKVLKEWQPTL